MTSPAPVPPGIPEWLRDWRREKALQLAVALTIAPDAAVLRGLADKRLADSLWQVHAREANRRKLIGKTHPAVAEEVHG